MEGEPLTENMIKYSVTVSVGPHTSTVEGYVEREERNYADLTERDIEAKVKAAFAQQLKSTMLSRKKVPRA